MEIHEIRPEISQALLTNPGIGFIAAPELMDAEPNALRDSRGQIVAPYKFTPDSRTWNHPDSGVLFCSCRWKDIEPLQGTYDWRCLEEKLDAAAALGCTCIVRISPYALSAQEDIPAWLRMRYPEEPEFPFWRIDPNTTAVGCPYPELCRPL